MSPSICALRSVPRLSRSFACVFGGSGGDMGGQSQHAPGRGLDHPSGSAAAAAVPMRARFNGRTHAPAGAGPRTCRRDAAAMAAGACTRTQAAGAAPRGPLKHALAAARAAGPRRSPGC